MKLEVVVIPVSDVDRAKEFYAKLGWRLDADFRHRHPIVQFTPHGSWCSIQFGKNLTSAAPGSAEGYLIVSDIEDARNGWSPPALRWARFSTSDRTVALSGPDPDHGSYLSLATFSDPDGNGWLLQEVTTRLPGRVDTGVTSFGSASDLASALRRAEAAHGEHEKRIGEADPNWPDWYAAYMVAEQAGTGLPT